MIPCRSRWSEPVGRCVRERAPLTRCCAAEDRGAGAPGCPSMRHQQTAAGLTRMCVQNSRKTLEEFILVDLDTLLHKVEVKMHGKILVYIHSQQRIEKCENCS